MIPKLRFRPKSCLIWFSQTKSDLWSDRSRAKLPLIGHILDRIDLRSDKVQTEVTSDQTSFRSTWLLIIDVSYRSDLWPEKFQNEVTSDQRSIRPTRRWRTSFFYLWRDIDYWINTKLFNSNQNLDKCLSSRKDIYVGLIRRILSAFPVLGTE